MKITYLCQKHAEWVYSHPEQAIHYLARDEYQGSMLFYDAHYREAIAYLGCAFDICVILLEVDGGENDVLKDKMESLARQLSHAYFKLGLEDYQQGILMRSREALQTGSYIREAVLHA
ncbi:hypothetical protein [Alteromonas confluentis]|uniref:Uncharacterized protein n=1 Tax=Alteromonas confluentis TaxID=1656094 RepID=A0A1E7ZEZ1_9ALTE|nr:hypothetical protein [Alteromonas confluentis]OFC72012.1 hypothetical protein BFC18_04725 [Alteromonas confluentis]